MKFLEINEENYPAICSIVVTHEIVWDWKEGTGKMYVGNISLPKIIDIPNKPLIKEE